MARQRRTWGSRIARVGWTLVRPRFWPRWVRRVFLLLLPVTLPLWIALILVLWVMLAFRALWQPIVAFWSAPQRHRYDYGPYSRYYGLVQPIAVGSFPEEEATLAAAE